MATYKVRTATLSPEWGPAEPLTIKHLADLFDVKPIQARNAAWLCGDEMEYLSEETVIPAALIGPVMQHLVEIYRKKNRVLDPGRDPVPFCHAMSWFEPRHGGGSRTLVTQFFASFERVPLGGYRKRGAYARE